MHQVWALLVLYHFHNFSQFILFYLLKSKTNRQSKHWVPRSKQEKFFIVFTILSILSYANSKFSFYFEHIEFWGDSRKINLTIYPGREIWKYLLFCDDRSFALSYNIFSSFSKLVRKHSSDILYAKIKIQLIFRINILLRKHIQIINKINKFKYNK